MKNITYNLAVLKHRMEFLRASILMDKEPDWNKVRVLSAAILGISRLEGLIIDGHINGPVPTDCDDLIWERLLNNLKALPKAIEMVKDI